MPIPYILTPAVVPKYTTDPFVAGSIDFRAFSDIALDFETWDIITPLVFVRGAAAVAQRMAIRLKTCLGEWFIDQRVGVPWLTRVFVVNPSERTLRRIFTYVIINTPGVARLDDMEIQIDRAARTVTISNFVVTLTDGSTLTQNPEAPFIGP